ncbi:MAG: NAD(P)/FAD-dependent oxidoreductase, partial [Nocardioides sp.]
GEDAFDGLVIASGLRSARLGVPGPAAGRFAIRTIEDVVALRAALADRGSGPAVVVGAGFIGTEVACTLTSMGVAVTVVEPAGAPMQRVLGREVAGAVQRHLEAGRIRFVIGAGVSAYAGSAAVGGVVLDTGETLSSSVVVEAVGSRCNVEWLAGNGLDLGDGVLTDNDLRVLDAHTVVAVGDIARFPNPLFDDVPRRVEHWSMPTDTARRAARTLLTDLGGFAPHEIEAGGIEPAETGAAAGPFTPIPSFWSDQLDLRLQSYGLPGLGDRVEIAGDLDDLPSGIVATYHRPAPATSSGETQHVGTVAINVPGAELRPLADAFGR